MILILTRLTTLTFVRFSDTYLRSSPLVDGPRTVYPSQT